MSGTIYDILRRTTGQIAVLVDPDKTSRLDDLKSLVDKINRLQPAFIFVGGSTVGEKDFHFCLVNLKKLTTIPLVIFPGSFNQLSETADGILFLSLISGRNPDYLIGHQIQAAHHLKKMDVEVIPTAYLLIEGGKNSSVAYVSQTTPIPTDQSSIAVNTAIAGEMMGMKAVFLDAGSGARKSVVAEMIREVKENITVPLIVGGGIRSIEQVKAAQNAGANVIVIGNKIEEDLDFLLDLMSITKSSGISSE